MSFLCIWLSFAAQRRHLKSILPVTRVIKTVKRRFLNRRLSQERSLAKRMIPGVPPTCACCPDLDVPTWEASEGYSPPKEGAQDFFHKDAAHSSSTCLDRGVHKVSTEPDTWLCHRMFQKWKNKFLWWLYPIGTRSFQWGQWKPGNKGSRIFSQQLKNLNPCPDCKVSFRILPEKISRKMAESHEGINPKGRYSPGAK